MSRTAPARLARRRSLEHRTVSPRGCYANRVGNAASLFRLNETREDVKKLQCALSPLDATFL